MKSILMIIAFFLVTNLHSQTTLSVGEIFDFSINDEFHTKKVYPPESPNAIRMKIIDKNFSASNDTVFYARSFNNYHTVFNPDPTPHLDYIFNIYQDTVYYTNLNDSVFCDVLDTSCVSIIDTTICGVITNGWEKIGLEQYWSKVFGKGLGIVRDVFVEDGSPDESYDYQLFYFKKDSMECGIPDSITTSIASNNLDLGIVDIYPNPFTDKFNIRFADDKHSYKIKIFDIQGAKIFETTVNDCNTIVIDKIYNKGCYIIEIETKGRSYISKIIKK